MVCCIQKEINILEFVLLFQFEEYFHPYTRHCLEQKECLEYIKAKEKENDLFKTFIVVSKGKGKGAGFKS